MRIKPYRVCDICGCQYKKVHGCMKVKRLYDPMRFTEMYGDLPIIETMDICPRCGKIMIQYIKDKIKERQ